MIGCLRNICPTEPMPLGTLLDDISGNHSCVPVNQCPCMLNGMVYGPGEITRTACQTW